MDRRAYTYNIALGILASGAIYVMASLIGIATAANYPPSTKPQNSQPSFLVDPTTGAATFGSGSSAAAENGHILKASAGSLYNVYSTASTTAGYLMVFNSATVPADGAVTPIECIQVAASQTGRIDYQVPEIFTTGISVAFSTTGCFTKTGSPAFFHWRVI
jgi:hypothetical protein